MNTTADLFAPTTESWATDAKDAFENWMVQQPGRGVAKKIRVSSAEVYRAQWGRFADWIGRKELKLNEVGPVDISDFLASLDDDNRAQRDRYRKLIQRVLADLLEGESEVGALNPAVVAMLEEGAKWKDVDGNLPTSFLTRQERAQLVEYLVSPISAKTKHQEWRDARDRAIVGLFMGAGLKVAAIPALTVNCIELRDSTWITVRSDDSQYSHRTRPAEYAVTALKTWLGIREEAGTEGDLVFPTDISPRIKNNKVNTGIHPATLKRITDTIILNSGVKAMRGEHRASPQTLRNTFGAVLFESGETPALVAEWMGFSKLITAERLQATWMEWNNSPRAQNRG